MKNKPARGGIVFLDAGTVDYGDISLEPLKKLGRFRSYAYTFPHQIPQRVRGASIVITNKCRFDRRLLGPGPLGPGPIKTLKAIAVTATGVNNIDLKAAREAGVAVMNVSNYSTESVVQSTFAFILSLAGNLPRYHEACRKGLWSRSPFFVLGSFPIQEVHGKVLGILGFGHIGRRVKEVGEAFGMKVFVGRIPGRNYPLKEKTRRVDFETLIRKSDFLTLHCPLTPLTRDLIQRKVLRKMKATAYLVNMARGGIVNERDLDEALRRRWIAGAACDVLTQEPPPRNHVFLKAPNILLTPHVAWASREARERLVKETALNIKAFLEGKKRNRVV